MKHLGTIGTNVSYTAETVSLVLSGTSTTYNVSDLNGNTQVATAVSFNPASAASSNALILQTAFAGLSNINLNNVSVSGSGSTGGSATQTFTFAFPNLAPATVSGSLNTLDITDTGGVVFGGTIADGTIFGAGTLGLIGAANVPVGMQAGNLYTGGTNLSLAQSSTALGTALVVEIRTPSARPINIA